MNEQEQNLADELEQLIKAAQVNQASKPQQVTPAEAELAQNLVTLSQTSSPSPAFVAQLRGRHKKRQLNCKQKKYRQKTQQSGGVYRICLQEIQP